VRYDASPGRHSIFGVVEALVHGRLAEIEPTWRSAEEKSEVVVFASRDYGYGITLPAQPLRVL